MYFIAASKERFYIVHAECKSEREADEWMLGEAIEIFEALENHQPVLPNLRSK